MSWETKTSKRTKNDASENNFTHPVSKTPQTVFNNKLIKSSIMLAIVHSFDFRSPPFLPPLPSPPISPLISLASVPQS